MKVSHKSSAGFGIIEILVVVVVLGIIGAGTYLYFQQAKTNDTSSGLTAQEQAEMQAACKLEIKDDLLCAGYTSWGAHDGPVTYTTTITDEDGHTYTSTAKYDGDNYHTVTNMGGQEMESMKVGSTSYTKMNGVWYKQALEEHTDMPDMEEDVESNPSSQVDEVISEDNVAKMSYKRVGEEACGDTTCVKFEVTSSDDPDNTTYLWINPSNKKLMRTQLKADDGSSWDMVFAYGPVTITPPTDAKDYSEMFSM